MSKTGTPVEAALQLGRKSNAGTEDDAVWKVLLIPPTKKFRRIKLAAQERQNDIDKRSAKMFAVHQKVSEAIRSHRTYAEIRSMIAGSNVVVNLPNQRQQKVMEVMEGKEAVQATLNVSYRQQGNLDMYSSTSMKRREQNRNHPEVKAAITRFWNLLPKTSLGNVNKSIYTWYSRQLFFTFVPAGTEQEFQQVVQEDWKNDAVYSCSMNERMFAFAVFNLADIWCETMDPLEYRDFINRCADTVEAAPTYNGTRKEGDVTETNDRANLRRLSAQPSEGNERRRTSGFEIFEEEDEVPVEETLEELERKLMNVENSAWYAALEAFSGYANNEARDCEDDLNRFFVQVQDRRYNVFSNESDASFGLQKNFFDEARRDGESRAQRIQAIKERLAILQRPVPTRGDLATRQKKRDKEIDQHHKEQRELLNECRDQTLHSFVRLREYHNSLVDLNRDALRETMSQVDVTQSDLHSFFALQLTDMGRRSEAENERNDNYFSFFVNLTKDLEEYRKLLVHREIEPIEQIVYPVVDVGRDVSEVKFDNPKWVTACEWLEKRKSLRNEFIEQMLFEFDEAITRAQFRGKQQLFAIHRQQIDFEGRLIDALANTNLLQNDIKLTRLAAAKQAKEENTARRAKETETFQNHVNEWKALLVAAQESHKLRISAEQKETKVWLKASDVSTAFAATKEVLEVMSGDLAEMEMEESVANGPRVVTTLPVGVCSPLLLVKFVVAQQDSWLLALVQKMAMSNAKVLGQSQDFLFRIESAEEMRQFENNMSLLNERLDDIHRIKKELTADETKAMLTMSCQVRLNHSADVRTALDEIQELVDLTRATIERFSLLYEQRQAQREATLSKLFDEQRYHLLQFVEVDQLRSVAWESRYTNQTAEARKAARQVKAMTEDRLKVDERLRLARERLAAEAQAAEDLRQQKLREMEEEQKKMRELKDLKAKDQAELRKKRIKEREVQLQEQLRREKEERRAWRDAFQQELEAQKVRAAGGTTPGPILRQTRRQTAAVSVIPPPIVRKKKQGAAGAGGDATNKVPKSASRIQQSIDAEIAMFKNLNTTSLAIDLNDFSSRRMEYFVDGSSNRQIYQSECSRLKVDPKASVEVLLSEESLDFQLSSLPLSHFTDLNIRTLLDVIALNPVQKILIRGIGLDKDDLKKLAQHLLGHPFIHNLDVSSNKDLGAHGGQTLLSLAKENPRIGSILAEDCGIEESALKEIELQCKRNQFNRAFSRTDFDFIQSIFQKLDADGNGTVDKKELITFLKTLQEEEVIPSVPSSPVADSTRRRRDDIRRVLLEMDSRNIAARGFTFADMLMNIYSHLTPADTQDIIRRYSDDSIGVFDVNEIQEFMDSFGVDGKLSLQQLASGLEEDPQNLHAAFTEADLDDDGFLNYDEFMIFVNH